MVKPELVEMYKSLCKRGRKKQRVMELMSEAIKTKEIFMDDKHIFNKETDGYSHIPTEVGNIKIL